MLFKKKFFSILLLFLLSIILTVNCDDNSPSVIVVGAGASGIAAASKLLDNGFKNVKILEAENRMGGRIFTTKLGDHVVDLGAQWVHGEQGNVVFEMASPHGLLDKGDGKRVKYHEKMMDSSGNAVDQTDVDDMNKFNTQVEERLPEFLEKNKNAPLGEFYRKEVDKYVDEHPKWKDNKKGLMNLNDMMTMSVYSADSWDDVSSAGDNEFQECPGEFFVNWKTNGYKTILDIMMKHFPKPEEELPVMSNTVLNAEVSEVDYSDPSGKVKVKTTNGDVHTADHVVVTCSVGVLKDKHKTMFKPDLPEDKQKAIEGMGFGNAAKVYLSYDEPWWTDDMANGFSMVWTDKDLEEVEKDNEKKWTQGIVGVYEVEHKPKLLELWVSGKHSRDMEMVSDEKVKEQLVEVLKKFFGKTKTVTDPTGMIRTKWHSNKNFMGVYGYRSPKSDPDVVNPKKLGEPVGEGKPMVLFAGEATSPHHFSSVHGAIESGWREADRIMAQHPDVKKS